MPKASEPQKVTARESFVAAIKGETYEVRAGAEFDADHALVKAYPHLFTAPPARAAVPHIEQATAAPGEKRGV
jgi:hypothetical protein